MRRRLAVGCAAVCALAAIATHAQPPLGRLFFTPQERARLSAARAGGAVDSVPVDAVPVPMAVSGIARNSRTGLVAWIDGQAVADGGTYAGYRVHVGSGGVILRRAGEPDRWLPVVRSLPIAGPTSRAAGAGVREAP